MKLLLACFLIAVAIFLFRLMRQSTAKEYALVHTSNPIQAITQLAASCRSDTCIRQKPAISVGRIRESDLLKLGIGCRVCAVRTHAVVETLTPP